MAGGKDIHELTVSELVGQRPRRSKIGKWGLVKSIWVDL